MPQVLHLDEFLLSSGSILDVRSPCEFLQGHIPGALSFPLFSDQERALVGTAYKKQSRQEAVALGLLIVEEHLEELMQRVSTLPSSQVQVLCWRGGMRSGFVARLLELFDFSVCTLQGGYKTYRRSVIKRLGHFDFPNVCILGGLTGSGKTSILQSLRKLGEQVIDLEALANHCGSAFGGIGHSPQPSQEQFENELASVLEALDPSKTIWIEDESRLIGRCHLPAPFYQRLIHAPLFYIERSIEERLAILLDQYGQAPADQLLEGVSRIEKRLGSQLSKEIKQFINLAEHRQGFERLLVYYDKTYQHQIIKRSVKHSVQQPPFSSSEQWASECLAINFQRGYLP